MTNQKYPLTYPLKLGGLHLVLESMNMVPSRVLTMDRRAGVEDAGCCCPAQLVLHKAYRRE